MAKEIQFILYNLPDNSGTVQAYVENETLWLTQQAMSQLFEVSVPAINQHLKNIYETNELTPEATIKKNLIVQQEGNRQVKREQTFYSLDAIVFNMEQFAASVNKFLTFNDYKILPNRGNISAAQAKAKQKQNTIFSIPHNKLTPILTKKSEVC